MAKQKDKQLQSEDKQPIITDASFQFLKNYINNPSPVGFESGGQKMWLDYMKPFIDSILWILMEQRLVL